MSREKSPDLNTCVQEVLREETRLRSTQSITSEPKIFFPSQEPAPVDDIALLIARGQKPQCYECKQYGHAARNCRQKLFCNYCKRNGRVISEMVMSSLNVQDGLKRN